MAAVPPFHGVGGRREQFVIKERERLLQMRRLQLVQEVPDVFIAAHPLAQVASVTGGARSVSVPLNNNNSAAYVSNSNSTNRRGIPENYHYPSTPVEVPRLLPNSGYRKRGT
jgi:hypothetical protein